MKNFIGSIPSIVNSDRFLQMEQKVDVEEMKMGIRNASARLKAEFKAMQVRCIVLLETHVVLRGRPAGF
jgi:hypothetical protein